MTTSSAYSKNLPKSFWGVQQIILMGLFIALTVVGAMIKVPSPTGTVAFDSLPSFLGAALLGWQEGFIIGSLGHLISAYTAGFPMTLPIHLLVAAEMALASGLFYLFARKTNLIGAVIVVTLFNGIVMPFTFVPFFGIGFFYAMLIPLTVAAFANALVAALCYPVLQKALAK